jgi:peptidoglycan hydrolase-like protein with peptidoglycan-binding domain
MGVALRRTRRTVLGAIILAAAAGVVVAVAQPAFAAGTCTTRALVRISIGTDSSAQIPASGMTDPTNCSMSQGTVSDGVKRLQQNLNQCYSSQLTNGISGSGLAYPGALLSEDGQFGPNTYKGLKLAQYYESHVGPTISIDGMYGPQTRSALRWWGSYYTANGQPRTGCARVVMPIQILSTTPPPPPTTPAPVTKTISADSTSFATGTPDPDLCALNPSQCFTYEQTHNVKSTMVGTRSPNQMAVTASWSLINDGVHLDDATFIYQVVRCSDNMSIDDHFINFETGTDLSTSQIVYTVPLAQGETYKLHLLGRGDIEATFFFSTRTENFDTAGTFGIAAFEAWSSCY